MDRPPDVDRFVDEWRHGKPENTHDRGHFVGPGTTVLSNEKTSDKRHLEQKGDCELRVPLPPDSPGFPAPERSRYKPHESKQNRKFGRGSGDAVGLRTTPEQIEDAGDAADADRREH